MHADDIAAVRAYLERRGNPAGLTSVGFLAAGEYNQNYLVVAGGKRYVLRVNRGSQLGLDDQIGYEYAVLRAVAPSGVTPPPRWVDPKPEGLPGGALLMDYLPGRPLDYAADLCGAGECFARIHALPPAPELIRQDDPVADILAESEGLLARFPDHPLQAEQRRLYRYRDRIRELYAATRHLFSGEPAVMVNTEVNSGNFLVEETGEHKTVRLADWEKAVVSGRYQDLGHFTAPTTTLWKTDVVLDACAVNHFLCAYRDRLLQAGVPAPEPDELREKTAVMARAVVLRGLSWCFMAYREYISGSRAIANPDTFDRIRDYLGRIEWFSAAVN